MSQSHRPHRVIMRSQMHGAHFGPAYLEREAFQDKPINVTQTCVPLGAERAQPTGADIMQLCLKARIACTLPLYAVLNSVIGASRLVSAADTHTEAKKQHGSLTLTSTYRLLTKLVDAGILSSHELGDGTTRFGLRLHDDQLFYLVDTENGGIQAISDDQLVRELRRVAKQLGFRLTRFRLVLNGKRRLLGDTP